MYIWACGIFADIIIGRRTRVTDIVEYVANAKWKWAGHIAQTKDKRWTIRSTKWEIEGVRCLENQSVVGEVTLWGNRERHGRR